MKQTLLTSIVVLAAATAMGAEPVDFGKIKHWAGNGSNQAALVVQFNDGKEDVAYIWGYRWDGTASGEDLLRGVAAASKSLSALVQYTGSMGSTVDGIGVSKNRALLEHLEYDFESAAVKGEVSFGYFEPNTMMGQTSAPGNDTPQLAQTAIDASASTGIIEHPLNARRYGYPAYDYDFWQLNKNHKEDADLHWQSGWYEGYWSFWIGQNGQLLSDASYSGLGMSSAELTDGSVNLWNFVSDMIPMGGAPEPSSNLDYDMTDLAEFMTNPEPETYAVDFDKINCWSGEGEKYAALVIKFNDGKSPDNLVLGYRWTGGWDDTVNTMMTNIFNVNKAFHVTRENGNIVSIAYDADGNGSIDNDEHYAASGTWQLFADYAHEPEIYPIAGGSFANPRAVIILTCTPQGAEPDYSTDNLAYVGHVDVPGNPDQPGAVVDTDASEPEVYVNHDGSITLRSCTGYSFAITDLSGRTLATFRCDSNHATVNPGTRTGLFLIHGISENNSITYKYIVK